MTGPNAEILPPTPKTNTWLVAVLVVIVSVAALKATYIVTMPLAMAFFLAVLVYPVQRWLNRRLPRGLAWLGVLAALLTVLLVMGAVVGLVWISVSIVSPKAPVYAQRLNGLTDGFFKWARQNRLPLKSDMIKGPEVVGLIMDWIKVLLGYVWSLLALLTIVFFISLMMLLEVHQWGRKVRSAMDGEHSFRMAGAVDLVAQKVRRFILLRTLVSAISAVVNGIWLWAMGVDFAFSWAVLFFLLNYIPNIGSIVATIPPVLIALIQFGLGQAMIVLGGIIILEQINSEVVAPRLEGRGLEVSPLVLVVSLLLWSWIWGLAGAVLAVPMTVMIIVACAQVEALRPLSILLSQTGRFARTAKAQNAKP